MWHKKYSWDVFSICDYMYISFKLNYYYYCLSQDLLNSNIIFLLNNFIKINKLSCFIQVLRVCVKYVHATNQFENVFNFIDIHLLSHLKPKGEKHRKRIWCASTSSVVVSQSRCAKLILDYYMSGYRFK